MQFHGIDRRSVAQQVADQLREAVIGAVLRSSQLPTEAELSQALTVSRPTLREALRILEAEGLVRRDRRTSALRPDAGAAAMSRPLRSALHVLTRTERISLAEILDLRLTIEARAAERAAEVATPDDLSELLAALEAIREPGLSGQSWNERTFAFHATMVKAAHNEAFLLIVLATREATADILEGAAQSAMRFSAATGPSSTTSRWTLSGWMTSTTSAGRSMTPSARAGAPTPGSRYGQTPFDSFSNCLMTPSTASRVAQNSVLAAAS